MLKTRTFRIAAILMVTLAFVLPSMGFAQDVSIEVEVSSKRIELGSAIQLTITVHGEKNVEPIQLPAIDGFDVKYLGPSTRVSVVNGQYSSSKSFIYSLFPQKVGQFQIPSSKVTIRNRVFTLPSIPIEVVSSMNQPSTDKDGQPTSLKDRLFIELKVPKKEVYLNEALPVKVLMFVSGLSARDIQYPDLNTIGFNMADYERPKQYQQIINGMRYDIVEFDTTIYPTRTGDLKLGPAKVECNVLVQTQGGQIGRGASVFDDDFFNSFFGRQQKKPITLESKQESITVLPMPEEGKPANFSGAVGQYDFNVSVSPTNVREGDPITLRTTIIGKGNLASIRIPSLPLDAKFKLYDPQIYEEGSIKKGEQVIIPLNNVISEVPALEFSYFDPLLKKYRTIKKGPFSINITKLENGEDFKVVGLEGEYRPIEPETFGKDIVFIKVKPGKLKVEGKYLHNSLVFYGIVLLTVFIWLIALMNYKRTHRIKTDIVYARRLLAPRKAKQGLAESKRLIAEGKKEEFYDEIFKTIQHYLGNKLHLTSGAVTAQAVEAQLCAKKIEQNVIDEVKEIFDECDMVRYASADINEEHMDASYQRLAKTIDHLERHLK